jgi:hypothetical protein
VGPEVRELLESVELQRVSGVVDFQSDDGSKRVQLVFGELFIPVLIAGGERRQQLAKATTAMTGAVVERSDPGVTSTSAAELLVCRTIFYQEMTEVCGTISQGSPPFVT